MKKLTDIEIQELLEKHIFNAESSDHLQTDRENPALDINFSDTESTADNSIKYDYNQSISAGDQVNDLETYALLFDLLKKEPEIPVPMSFARQVTRRLVAENTKINDFRFYLLISMISLFGLAIAYYSLSMLDKKTSDLFIETLINYKWLCAFTLGGLFIVQLIVQRMDVRTTPKNS